MIFDLQPILENDLLLLRPLKAEDFENLYEVASDPMIWEQHPDKNRWERAAFQKFFQEALDSKGAFIIIDKKKSRVIGSTRFAPIKETQNAIEIGWSFLDREYWGGQFNKAIKTLMMDYAFQFVGHIVFFINEKNIRSQKAVEKLGGQRITSLDNEMLEPRVNATFIYVVSNLIHARKGNLL
jgi:N-acetyltransferase